MTTVKSRPTNVLSVWEKVFEFNKTSGNFVATEFNYISEKMFNQRFALIAEEIRELREAKDFEERLDALVDIVYVVAGMATAFGINTDLERNFEMGLAYFKNVHHNRPTLNPNDLALSLWDNVLVYKDQLDSFDKHVELLDVLKNDLQSCFMEGLSDIGDQLVAIIVCVYYMSILINFDFMSAFDAVHNANMSKFCKDEQTAIDTVQWYRERPELGYLSPTYIKVDTSSSTSTSSPPSSSLWVVKNEETGKILKSILWKEEKNLARFINELPLL